MSAHDFKLRQICRYAGDDNKVEELTVEVQTTEGWQPLELNLTSPGFLLFVYTIFTCQHMYMRINAAERGLGLASSLGVIEVEAGDDWVLERLHVEFEVQLASGTPAAGDVEYIEGRMRQCPVSKNLKAPANSQALLRIA
jgi:hypothetical protein